ncbi:hypothetical protein ED562_08260 [Microcystis aeruginosa FACHB-524]|uniref:hypothetical protein n=1 Tax=Microcystis aeruginosa TaxID=1126 RepID=UPI000F450B16|nr:hypothetical protein [Microcystis aeruginosa]ROI07061.1 hypothetical protein ED562_08260 [Microcystis aeruginosa FACHB-524]
MNNTIKTPQKSSIPYNTTGYHDRKITSPIKPAISRIKAYLGRNCQDKPNFTARVGLDAAQKINFSGGVA